MNNKMLFFGLFFITSTVCAMNEKDEHAIQKAWSMESMQYYQNRLNTAETEALFSMVDAITSPKGMEYLNNIDFYKKQIQSIVYSPGVTAQRKSKNLLDWNEQLQRNEIGLDNFLNKAAKKSKQQ